MLITVDTGKQGRHSAYKTTHHMETGFRNIWPGRHIAHPSGSEIAGWYFSFIAERVTGSKKFEPTPVRKIDPEEWQEGRVFWLGQATIMFRMNGKWILTDPVFYDRASPFSFVGPRRLVDRAVELDKIPDPDIILLSHNHYDHLDQNAIRFLAKKNPLFIVPLKNAAYLKTLGVSNITEMDWWEYAKIDDLTIHCTPAKHFSNRWLNDRNHSLWSGFFVEGDYSVYFAGDTAYASLFSEIEKVIGAPDIAALPIGAYLPRWFMQEVHMDPEDAVRAFLDLKAKTFLPIHWGTFDLADEPLHEPPQLTEKIAAENGIKNDRLKILPVGGWLTP